MYDTTNQTKVRKTSMQGDEMDGEHAARNGLGRGVIVAITDVSGANAGIVVRDRNSTRPPIRKTLDPMPATEAVRVLRAACAEAGLTVGDISQNRLFVQCVSQDGQRTDNFQIDSEGCFLSVVEPSAMEGSPSIIRFQGGAADGRGGFAAIRMSGGQRVRVNGFFDGMGVGDCINRALEVFRESNQPAKVAADDDRVIRVGFEEGRIGDYKIAIEGIGTSFLPRFQSRIIPGEVFETRIPDDAPGAAFGNRPRTRQFELSEDREYEARFVFHAGHEQELVILKKHSGFPGVAVKTSCNNQLHNNDRFTQRFSDGQTEWGVYGYQVKDGVGFDLVPHTPVVIGPGNAMVFPFGPNASELTCELRLFG